MYQPFPCILSTVFDKLSISLDNWLKDAMLIKTSESFQWHHSEAGIKSCTAQQGQRARANCQQKKRNISVETLK